MEKTNEMVTIKNLPTGKDLTITKLHFNILRSKGLITYEEYRLVGDEMEYEWVLDSNKNGSKAEIVILSNVLHEVRCNNCMWTGDEEDLITVVLEKEEGDTPGNHYAKACPNCKVDDYLMSGVFLHNKHYNTFSKFDERFGDFYSPDNAEDEEENCSFMDFMELCNDEWEDDEDLQKTFDTPEKLLDLLISVIDWQHPSTMIEEIKIDISE